MPNIWCLTCATFLSVVLRTVISDEGCPEGFFLQEPNCYHWAKKTYTKAEGERYCFKKTNGLGSLKFLYKRGSFSWRADNIYRFRDIKWDDERTVSFVNGKFVNKGGLYETRALCEMEKQEVCFKGSCESINLGWTRICITCVERNSAFAKLEMLFSVFSIEKKVGVEIIQEDLKKWLQSQFIFKKKEEKRFIRIRAFVDWISENTEDSIYENEKSNKYQVIMDISVLEDGDFVNGNNFNMEWNGNKIIMPENERKFVLKNDALNPNFVWDEHGSVDVKNNNKTIEIKGGFTVIDQSDNEPDTPPNNMNEY